MLSWIGPLWTQAAPLPASVGSSITKQASRQKSSMKRCLSTTNAKPIARSSSYIDNWLQLFIPKCCAPPCSLPRSAPWWKLTNHASALDPARRIPDYGAMKTGKSQPTTRNAPIATCGRRFGHAGWQGCYFTFMC